jgi:hypothetical protein
MAGRHGPAHLIMANALRVMLMYSHDIPIFPLNRDIETMAELCASLS